LIYRTAFGSLAAGCAEATGTGAKFGKPGSGCCLAFSGVKGDSPRRATGLVIAATAAQKASMARSRLVPTNVKPFSNAETTGDFI
jgi:hypothetical protein